MLTESEIKQFIDGDRTSELKIFAKTGSRYYDGDHDIKRYRMFYYNSDGKLVEDKMRSNVRIPHPFFVELVDQAVQYILSGGDIIRAKDARLQSELDKYFNNNDAFGEQLAECLTDCMISGWSYMYAYKNANDMTTFMAADAAGVVEVRDKDTDDGCEYVIYTYVDRIDKGKKKINRIQVWDRNQVTYYVQVDDGAVHLDDTEPINPRPHVIYKKDGATYFENFGYIPFFRIENNKKRFSSLRPVKDLIDDYDLMASSLSNNLIDFDTPLYAVKGFQGDNFDELQQNLKTKKMIGLDEEGGIEVKTVDVPYQARQAKLELDEKNIYRFGMGLNTSGLKDTNATTNIAIKAMYSLLDLKCSKIEIRIRKLLRSLVNVVIDEINEKNNTAYGTDDVYFEFNHTIMSNAQENAQIKYTEAQTRQIEINTILSLADVLDDETVLREICDWLDIDYEDIKSKLQKDDDLAAAKAALANGK